MKKKAYLKIVLDIVMCILLVLFYNKRVISMKYHEVSGLVAIGLIIVHNAVNYKWIKAVGSKVFSGKMPVKTVISFIVNVILFILIFLIGISGVLISKTILTNISSNNVIWKLIHMSASGYLLIFLGIHLGLHFTYLKNICKKIIKVPSSVSKSLGVIFTVIIIAFGTYNMFNTSFIRWLSMPAKIVSISSGGDMSQKGNHDSNKPHNNNQGKRPEGRGENTEHRNNNMHPMQPQKIDVMNIINVIIKYLSIVLVFAIATYGFERLLFK